MKESWEVKKMVRIIGKTEEVTARRKIERVEKIEKIR